MIELSVLIAGHTSQMINGAGLAKMTTNPAIRVFGLLHVSINLLVIVTEIHIIYRAAKFLIRRRHRYCRSATYRKTYSLKEMLIALAITLAWQLTYIVLAEIVT